MGKPSTHERFTVRLAVIAMLATALVFGGFFFHAVQSFWTAQEIAGREIRLKQLAREIVHLDEAAVVKAKQLIKRTDAALLLERDSGAPFLSAMVGMVPILLLLWVALLWALRRWQKLMDQSGREMQDQIRAVESAKKALEWDVTERKQVEEQMLHEALHDSLTGLPNRTLCIDRLGRSIGRAKRRADYLFAILFLDVDRFKVINDSLGHAVGEKLLQAMVQRLLSSLRPSDTLARFGGDKFTVLLEDMGDISDATRVADRIQKELTVPFHIDQQEIFVTVSIGIAQSKTGYDQPEDFLRDAETAMYRAKTLGRARYQVFDADMHSRAVSLLRLENDLRRAIERNEFEIHYQPIVSLKTGRLSGFEALVRWRHPQRGLLCPVEFLSVVEEMDLILQMDHLVLRESCRQMKQWQVKYPQSASLMVSVNISGKHFSHPGLIDFVDQIVRETGLDPHTLKLEIPESGIMENPEMAERALFQLKDRNIGLLIDDFGSGYSSLASLHRFPIETLKIDRSFVTAMEKDGENIEIVRAIVVLAHNLSMDVIAEGIETQEQLAVLKELGCEYGQGYFFAKPMDRAVAESYLHPSSKVSGGRTESKEAYPS